MCGGNSTLKETPLWTLKIYGMYLKNLRVDPGVHMCLSSDAKSWHSFSKFNYVLGIRGQEDNAKEDSKVSMSTKQQRSNHFPCSGEANISLN